MTTAVIRRLMSIQKKVLWTPAHLQCVILAGDDAGQSGNLDVAAKVRMEDVVTVARRMREQVAERDRRPGIAQLRRTVGIEAVEHLYVADNRQHVAHRLVETDAPLLDELHGGGAGDGLGHRGDAKHRIGRHRFGLVDRPHAEGSLVEDAAIVGHKRHDTGNEIGFDRFAEGLVEIERRARLRCRCRDALSRGRARRPRRLRCFSRDLSRGCRFAWSLAATFSRGRLGRGALPRFPARGLGRLARLTPRRRRFSP
jgi:hypothetical protein